MLFKNRLFGNRTARRFRAVRYVACTPLGVLQGNCWLRLPVMFRRRRSTNREAEPTPHDKGWHKGKAENKD